MKTTYSQTSFAKSLLAGLLTGLITAGINTVYIFIYRSATGVAAYDVILSPGLVFIGFPLLLLLMSMLYYGMAAYMKKGSKLFTLFIILLALAAIVFSLNMPVPDNLSDPAITRGLVTGIELITGLMAAFLLPYLARHPRIFMTSRGLREEA